MSSSLSLASSQVPFTNLLEYECACGNSDIDKGRADAARFGSSAESHLNNVATGVATELAAVLKYKTFLEAANLRPILSRSSWPPSSRPERIDTVKLDAAIQAGLTVDTFNKYDARYSVEDILGVFWAKYHAFGNVTGVGTQRRLGPDQVNGFKQDFPSQMVALMAEAGVTWDVAENLLDYFASELVPAKTMGEERHNCEIVGAIVGIWEKMPDLGTLFRYDVGWTLEEVETLLLCHERTGKNPFYIGCLEKGRKELTSSFERAIGERRDVYNPLFAPTAVRGQTVTLSGKKEEDSKNELVWKYAAAKISDWDRNNGVVWPRAIPSGPDRFDDRISICDALKLYKARIQPKDLVIYMKLASDLQRKALKSQTKLDPTILMNAELLIFLHKRGVRTDDLATVFQILNDHYDLLMGSGTAEQQQNWDKNPGEHVKHITDRFSGMFDWSGRIGQDKRFKWDQNAREAVDMCVGWGFSNEQFKKFFELLIVNSPGGYQVYSVEKSFLDLMKKADAICRKLTWIHTGAESGAETCFYLCQQLGNKPQLETYLAGFDFFNGNATFNLYLSRYPELMSSMKPDFNSVTILKFVCEQCFDNGIDPKRVKEGWDISKLEQLATGRTDLNHGYKDRFEYGIGGYIKVLLLDKALGGLDFPHFVSVYTDPKAKPENPTVRDAILFIAEVAENADFPSFQDACAQVQEVFKIAGRLPNLSLMQIVAASHLFVANVCNGIPHGDYGKVTAALVKAALKNACP